MDNVLEAAGCHSYWWWMTVGWQPFSSGYLPYSTQTSALDAVMGNVDVQREIATMPEAARSSVRATIDRVLVELSHNFSPRSIPHLGYILSKVFRRLFREINVDISDFRSHGSPEGASVPTLYLPTHRSYLDFLLLPWLCFHYRLKLPVVAAAIDFSSMAVVAGIMRRCGAFFIRRRVSDRLYAAILRAYVQHLALTCPLPMEFFLEGTRSRTGKALSPKTGLLQVFMELVDSGRVPDVNLVPISISYDRLLEENLFAREMLGVPKPKESTSALFRALGVLTEDYGRVHVKFHRAISLRHRVVQQSPVQVALSVLQCHVAISHCTCMALLASACLLLEGTSVEMNLLCFRSVVRLARFISSSLKLLKLDYSRFGQRNESSISVDDISEEAIARTLAVSGNIFSKTGNTLILNNFTELATLASNEVDTVPMTVLQWSATRLRLQCYSNTVLSAVVVAAVETLSSRSGFSWSLAFLVDLLLLEFPVLFRCQPDVITHASDRSFAGVFKLCEETCCKSAHTAGTSGGAVCTSGHSASTSGLSIGFSGVSDDTCGRLAGASGSIAYTSGRSATTSGPSHQRNDVLSAKTNKQISDTNTQQISYVSSSTSTVAANSPRFRDDPKQRSYTFEDMCSWMVLPYLHAYLYIFRTVLKNGALTRDGTTAKQLHQLLKKQLTPAELDRNQQLSADSSRYQLLPTCLHLTVSQDVISNCLNTLVRMAAARKQHRDSGGTLYHFSTTRLMEIHEKLFNLLQRCCCCCCRCNYGAPHLPPHTDTSVAKL